MTARVLNSELVTQVPRELDEIKMDLNSYILQVIVFSIADNVLPHFQNSLGELENPLNVKEDCRSTGLHRNPEVGANRKIRSNQSKTDFNHGNFASDRRQSSLDSQNSESSYHTGTVILLSRFSFSTKHTKL